MGIAIVSAPVAASSALPASTGSALPADALLGEFAALLSGQLGLASVNGKTLEPALNTESSTSAADEPEALLSDAPIPLDPGLAFIVAPSTPVTPTAAAHTSKLTDAAAGIDPDNKGKQLPLGLQEQARDNVKAAGKGAIAAENGLLNASTAGKPAIETTTANIAADLPNTFALSQQASSAAQANHLAHPAAASQSAHTRASIDTPVRDSQWAQSFGEKVVWLAKNEQVSAQITLNPPQLGPMQVSLQLNGDQASAVFASPHAEVRQAIQDSLPQLKEMLASAGINLGQADIGANMARQNREMPFQSANGQRSSDENAILAGSGNTVDSAMTTPIQRGRGMVDLFA